MDEIKQKRKHNRLFDYDYSQAGTYFVTICAEAKKCIFGKVIHLDNAGRPQVQLFGIGRIIDESIIRIGNIYELVTVEKYVIMPNHVHLLIMISDSGRQVAAPTVSQIIGNLKRAVSMNVGAAGCRQFAVWQKGFHDHIIRNQNDYEKIWNYIDINPDKWFEDKYYT